MPAPVQPRATLLPDAATRRVLWVAVPLGLLAAFGLPLAVRIPALYDEVAWSQPAIARAFERNGLPGVVNVLTFFSRFCGALVLLAFLAAFVRRPWALSAARKGYIAYAVWFGFYAYAVFASTDILMRHELDWHGFKATAVAVFFWRWSCLWPAGFALLVGAGVYIVSWRRLVLQAYGYPAPEPAVGDRIVEDLRTHGRDPRYRKSFFGSFALHIVVLVLIPFLLQFVGCVEPYLVPKGSGQATPPPVIKVVKPKVKKKRYIVNPNAAILFSVPDMDQVLNQVEEATQLTYKADPTRVHGKGKGKMGVGGGTQGGWPDGMDNAVVRFIRLEYSGEAWDDGMDALSRADMNFLEHFKKITGFKIAREPESHAITLLRKYPKGFAPPFVYMTGKGSINVSATEVRILRDYLLDGGMLFADCSSPNWDRSFRSFAQVLFPGEPLRVIADDDPIFQLPNTFANGAPPLWHHGGSRALGIKHRNRWVVFYHPGDINDAWKSGHSGMDASLANGAYDMGVNIIYYAFTRYLEQTRKYRK